MESQGEQDPRAIYLLRQRVESIAALASGLAHDLMSVLASISMSIELLGPKLAPEDAWLAETLAEGVQRGNEGVRQIFWLAATKTGGPILYDPLHLVKETRSLMAQAFPGIRVSADYPAEVGVVHGEPSLLRQLLIGLCIEACTRMPVPQTLDLRASRVTAGTTEGRAGARARFDIESRTEDGEPAAAIAEAAWRDRPAMAALLAAVAEQGGTVEGEGEEGEGFRVRIEVPVVTQAGSG